MDTKHERSSAPIQNPELHHEESDVDARGIIGFGLGLALCIALSSLVLYVGFNSLRDHFTVQPVHPSPLIGVREPVEAEDAPKDFPNPRLQTNYYGDLDVVRKQWATQLDTYGWQDKNAGVVHIPIDEAMRLTLERGLPARTSAAQPAAGARTQGTPPASENRTKLVASRN
jgi:hypothetical protein